MLFIGSFRNLLPSEHSRRLQGTSWWKPECCKQTSELKVGLTLCKLLQGYTLTEVFHLLCVTMQVDK